MHLITITFVDCAHKKIHQTKSSAFVKGYVRKANTHLNTFWVSYTNNLNLISTIVLLIVEYM